jgi:NAD(P)-dependent dehydrogenase (short-subunit alcohol dehydrogenase family)
MSGVVLVTGAGRGIGAAIARLAGQRGYKVGVNYSRSVDDAKKVVADIERDGGKAIAVQGDVGEEKDVLAMFEAMDKAFGPVTALVNNAGILGKPTSSAKLGADLVEHVLRVNVTGTLMCSREAIRRMSPPTGNGGVIVNIGSIAARTGGMSGCVAYAASKGAVDSLTTGLAKEFGPLNIRVNCIRPGLIESDIHDAATGGIEASRKAAKATVPLGGRMGQPNEIATMALWLMSDEASYVTAAVYDVSAGR